MSKLSFNDLINIKNGLLSILENGKSYSFNLIYALNKNVKKIEAELEEIRDLLPDDADGFQEFQQKKVELAESCGADIQRTKEGMVRIANSDNVDVEKYEEGFEELKEEYSDVLDKQAEINEKRQKLVDEHVAEVDWTIIKKDYFPETIEPKELPIQIIDLIED